jgi:hypothetical protein
MPLPLWTATIRTSFAFSLLHPKYWQFPSVVAAFSVVIFV